jgi:hypothetical protein
MSFGSPKNPSPEELSRQQEANLKRIARESDVQDLSQIQKWVELGKKIFDKDKEPNPSGS